MYKEQKMIQSHDMWCRFIKMTNVLCSDGVQRVFVPTAENDTFWTTPGRVQVKGKTITGHLYYSNEKQVWMFAAYTYRKNGHMLHEEES